MANRQLVACLAVYNAHYCSLAAAPNLPDLVYPLVAHLRDPALAEAGRCVSEGRRLLTRV
jgi:hypothetical protein